MDDTREERKEKKQLAGDNRKAVTSHALRQATHTRGSAVWNNIWPTVYVYLNLSTVSLKKIYFLISKRKTKNIMQKISQSLADNSFKLVV